MYYQISSLLTANRKDVFEFCRSKEGFCHHFPFKVEWQRGPAAPWTAGDVIEFRYRAYGIWFRHCARLAACEPPHIFTDVQEVGLYQKFIHTHRFETEGGMTWVIDEIEFSLGYGNTLDFLLGRPIIHSVFRKRHQKLREIFGGYRKSN